MKLNILGSGSQGNATCISVRDGTTVTHILLDCGFSLNETERRLIRAGINPAELSALIITHEHTDHIRSAFSVARKYNLPIWMSSGTFQAAQQSMPRSGCEDADIYFCRDGDCMEIRDVCVTAFTVPHDAREPLQFHMSDGQRKLGVLTDTGVVTEHMQQMLAGCDALVLECNHDEQMLASSIYPNFLKKRIRGHLGHLSNTDAAALLGKMDHSKLKMVIGAHLSQQNNNPGLVQEILRASTCAMQTSVWVAEQENGVAWLEI